MCSKSSRSLTIRASSHTFPPSTSRALAWLDLIFAMAQGKHPALQ